MTKSPCQILIAFKKLLVRFVLIQNKATDNIAINFLLLSTDQYGFFSTFLKKIAFYCLRYGQASPKLIIPHATGHALYLVLDMKQFLTV